MASIDALHPWPWLEAFTEDASAFFNGRDEDVDAALQVVALAPVTVLFGRSGLGKTSLLQAGVFPRLAQRRMFPVLLKRLDHGPRGAELSARWLARLDAEAAARGLAWQGGADEASDERARLWERLHRHDGGWRDAAGARWTPLLVLDQFEEVFTLESDPGARRLTFEELGDLLENRIPAAVAARIDADEALLDRLDLDAQPYRCLVSLREDFLPELETWTALVPRLAAQRLRLLPMDRAQALAAVLRTGGALVDEASAQRIAAFLGQQGARGHEAGGIEPALLSLVCASLNAERLERGLARLDVEHLESSGARILDRFYDQAFEALPEAARPMARAWVESELITAGGTRRPYPRRALAPELAGALETLVRQRLLRVENAEHGEFVELVHDRLAAVAAERARLARERAQREAQERAGREKAARRRARNRTIGVVGAVLLVTTLGGLLFMIRQYQVAELARSELFGARLRQQEAFSALAEKSDELEAQRKAAVAARDQAASSAEIAEAAALLAHEQETRANTALATALVQTRAATAFRLAAEGQTLASGEREGGVQRALLSMLAGYRLSQGATPQARNAALAALQSQADGGLLWVRDAPAAAAIAISPDGKLAVTGGREGVPQLHDAQSGAWLGSLPLRAGPPITALAISPDGRTLVTGNRLGVRRWDLQTKRELALPMTTRGEVAFVGFVGGAIVAASESGFVRWNPDGTAAPVELGRPGLAARLAAVTPSGRRIAVARPDGSIEFIDPDSGKALAVIDRDPDPAQVPTALAFTRYDNVSDEAALVVGYETGALRRYDWKHALEAESVTREGGAVRELRSLGYSLIQASADGRLRFRDESTLSVRSTVKSHAAGVAWAFALTPRGTQLLSVGQDRQIARREVYLDASPSRARIPGTQVSFDADGRGVAGRTSQGGLQRWTLDGQAGRALFDPGTMKVDPFDRVVRAVRSRDGRRLLTSGNGRFKFALLDAADGRILASDRSPPVGAGEVLAISEDGRLVAASQGDNTVRVFGGADLKPLGAPLKVSEEHVVKALAFGPGARTLVASSDIGELVRWDLPSRQEHLAPGSVQDDGTQALAVSPDGRWLARAGNDGVVHIGDIGGFEDWRPEGGVGHGTQVLQLAFSPGGQVLASASGDGHVRLWSVPDGAPLGQPIRSGMNGGFNALTFSPDGRTLAASSDAGEARLWPVLDAWADEDCTRLSRNMTHAEWRDWVSAEIAYVEQCPGKPVPPDAPGQRR